MTVDKNRHARIGILDHVGFSLGGGQLVVGRLAETLSQQHDVEIIHAEAGYTLERLKAAFRLDLSRVRERTFSGLPGTFSIPGDNSSLRQSLRIARALSQPYDVLIYSGHGVPPFCYARRGLVYCHFPMESSPLRELQIDPRWANRNPIDRWIRGRAYEWLWRKRMRKYTTIFANSLFTASWIKRRWGKAAEVLYPPVEVSFPGVAKRSLIVSVGRFTGSRRSKNQLEQVRAFREVSAQIAEDWRLCLIGSCGSCSEDRAYLDAVERAAEGLPVSFLVDEEREAICRTLAEAKLFWHTAGLSVNEAAYPQEAEHFGIATVEAMRAGCVPVVVAAGGQREIVEDGVSGFLVQDLHDLIQRSVALAREESLLERMSRQALQRSMAFTREVFDARVRVVVAQGPDL